MSLVAIGSRHPVTCTPAASVADVVRMMEESSVGCVIVTREDRPVGIVTDRDLVLRVLRKGRDPTRTRAEQVMSPDPETAPDVLEPIEAATRMREARVRRLPVVDAGGRLIGIVTLDDLFHHVGRTGGEMAEAIASFPAPFQGG
jgi:CBS domain-containing protein